MSAIAQEIEKLVHSATGEPFTLSGKSGVGGGCIHNASRISGVDGRQFFLKQNSSSHLEGFKTEELALKTMADTRTIRVPEPIGTAVVAGQAILVMEYLPMGARGGDWQAMGRNLARLHKTTRKSFGWPENNFIGSTPQLNDWMDDWISFYREFRLQPQMKWARKRGLGLDKGAALLDKLPAFFESYSPAPSLLHGDLWSGNAGFLQNGSPVIFDPACYYGDREADLAMTEMFGGFPSSFYRAYDQEWAVDPGYKVRKSLYNLYHELNHYNLFGGGYGYQAEATISRLLNSLY